MSTEQTENEIIQNLKDAGLGDTMIADFINCWRNGSMESGMKLLTAKRKELLDEIHAGQRKLDCLDYLMYELQRE